MKTIVAKFGGSSLADAEQVKKVMAIVWLNPERQYVVVSAPGKRNPQDQKVTDLLYRWHQLHITRSLTNEIQQTISDRYEEIIRGLGLSFNLKGELNNIGQRIDQGASPAYAASRGEYLMGKIIALALGYKFVDPADCIRFDKNGRYHQADGLLRSALKGRNAVIPGFYGARPDGLIQTFSRGGSDITGAIVARAVKADLYENWTDVSGLLMADPRVVQSPSQISVVTYRELRELAYMGANVFHEEAMFPVYEAEIPTHILNTNDPDNHGTRIVPEGSQRKHTGAIIGVAGRQGFTVITVKRMMMNQRVGFLRQILTVLEENGISFENAPGGIDVVSVIIDNRQLGGKLEKIVHEIDRKCSPDAIEVHPNIAMIATVSRAMAHKPGVVAKIFAAMAKKHIEIRTINDGSSETTIIIGVKNNDYEDAVRAIYGAFVT